MSWPLGWIAGVSGWVAFSVSTFAYAGEPCRTNADCAMGSACTNGACAESAEKAPPKSLEPGNVRLGLAYAPTVLLSDSSRSKDLADPMHGVATGAHHLGVEASLGSGYFRYHLMVAFSAADGATGLRIEPTTLGVAIPLLKKPKYRLEIEPTAHVVDIAYLGADENPGSAVTVSSGADVRVNFAWGKLFFAASPAGFDVRYAGIDASAAKARAFAGAAVYYRLRLFVGFEL